MGDGYVGPVTVAADDGSERVLKDIFELLKQDIDLKSTTTIHGFSAET